MNKIIVPLNAFNKEEVLEKGQESFVSSIYKAGAYGIEIRRELFPKTELPLLSIKEELKRNPLFTVYSAPVELWLHDGSLNLKNLQQIFQEAKLIEASWIKVSLGHFNDEISDTLLLKQFLMQEKNIQLLVENDQTIYGGCIQSIKSFFESVCKNNVPVKMTFDIGNWLYSEQSVQEAIDALKENVTYLHLKHVVQKDKHLITLPLPADENAHWRMIVNQFPREISKALEFPLQSNEPLKSFIKLVETQLEKVGG